MPFELSPESEPTQGFQLTPEPSSSYSETQEDKIAMSAALAERNLKGQEDFDIGGTYATNKNALKNGQEEQVRTNIFLLENQTNIQDLKEEFNNTVLQGNLTGAERAVQLAKEQLNSHYKDSVEFNALETFRVDKEDADGELLDNTQALIASGALANQDKDKQTNAGFFYQVGQKYIDLQKSANQHGNSLKSDIVYGIANGLPAALEGVADNINNLLPDSYWELLAGESGAEALKKAVLQESKKDTLGKFSVGDVGKASEAMSSFAIGMATVAKFLPSVSGTGLNALRLTAAGTLADSAVFTGIDSAVKHITDAFPSTLNPITQYLGDRSENSPWENKAKQAIEATALNAVAEGVIFGAIKSVKALKNLKSENVVLEEIADDVIKSSIVTGDRQTGAIIAQKKLAGSEDLSPLIDQVTTVDNAIEAATPTVLKTPLDIKMEVGITGNIEAQFNRQKVLDLANTIDHDVHSVNRLNEEEMASAVSSFKENLVGLTGEHSIMDFKIDLENGVNVANIHLGKKSGGGYSSEKVAKNQADQLGIDYNLTKTPSGEYFITTKKVVPEVGFVKDIDYGDTSWLVKNTYGRNALHPAEYLPDHLLEDIELASNSRTTMRREYIQPLMSKYYKSVSKEEFEHVNNIAAIGRDSVNENGTTGRWFSPEEFDAQYDIMTNGKTPSNSVRESYKAYRELNDLQYTVENRNEYTRKARLGYEEITIGDIKGNGIVKNNLDATQQYRVYDPQGEGRVYKPNEITAEELETKYKDHKIIQLENDVKLPNGEYIKYILSEKGGFKTSMLDPIQVGYRAGGRVIYAGKYFSKQAVVQTLEDGSKINRNPLTHYTSETRQELVAHTSKLENARNAYRSAREYGQDGGRIPYKEVIGINKDGTFRYDSKGKVLTEAQANEIISKTVLSDVDDFAKALDDGAINKDSPFEVRGDKELPLAYSSTNTSYIDENHSGASTWLLSNKKAKFRSRGDRLYSPDEQQAKVLSPFEAMERSINGITNSGMAGNYVTRIGEQFTATAKAHGFLKEEFKNASSAQIFFEGENALIPNINGIADLDYQATLTTLKAMQRGLGYKGKVSLMKDAQIKKFSEWLETESGSLAPPTANKQKASKLVSNLADKDPLNAVNTFMYHTNFSFFALHQLVTQGGGGYLSTLVQSPIKATQSLMGSMVHANYFFREDAGAALSKNKALMNLLGWKDSAEYTGFLQHMKKSGYVNVTGSHIDLARKKMFTGKKGTNFELLDKAFESSSVAVRTGEALNQIVGYETAYKTFREQYPKVDINTAASTGWIIREANKITYNMKATTKREISQGVMAIPFRYKQFFMNVLEAQTVGGKRTPQQKAQFWAGTTAMFGVGTGVTYEVLKDNLGIQDNKTLESINNGFIHYLTSDSEGDVTVDLSNTLGNVSPVLDMYNQWASEDSKMWAVAGGALYSKVNQFKDRGANALLFMSNVEFNNTIEDNGKLALESLNEMSKVLSSWSNYSKGKVALDTGKIYSNKGALITDTVSNSTATLMMLGLKSPEEMKVFKTINPTLREQAKEIQDKADTIGYFLMKAKTVDRTTDSGAWQFKEYNKIAKVLSTNDPNRSDIMKKVRTNNFTSKTSKEEFGEKKLARREKDKVKFELKQQGK